MSLLQFTLIIRLHGTMLPRFRTQLERELDRARAADLVERVEAAAAEVVVQHLRSLPELRRVQAVDWAAEVRVIQAVEEIASELQRNPFCKAELAAQGDIPLWFLRSGILAKFPCYETSSMEWLQV
jgi:hypothetical protein